MAELRNAFILGEELGVEHSIYDSQLVPDIEGLVEQLGGNIRVEHSQQFNPDLLRVYDDNDFEILISTNTSEALDRFNIARALGHYSMHRSSFSPQAIFRHRENESGRSSRQAGAFARGLLLPTSNLEDLLEKGLGVQDIATMLKLSKTFVAASVDMKLS